MSITDIFRTVDATQTEADSQNEKGREPGVADRRSRVGAETDAAVVKVLDEVWKRNFGSGFHPYLKN